MGQAGGRPGKVARPWARLEQTVGGGTAMGQAGGLSGGGGLAWGNPPASSCRTAARSGSQQDGAAMARPWLRGRFGAAARPRVLAVAAGRRHWLWCDRVRSACSEAIGGGSKSENVKMRNTKCGKVLISITIIQGKKCKTKNAQVLQMQFTICLTTFAVEGRGLGIQVIFRGVEGPRGHSETVSG